MCITLNSLLQLTEVTRTQHLLSGFGCKNSLNLYKNKDDWIVKISVNWKCKIILSNDNIIL